MSLPLERIKKLDIFRHCIPVDIPVQLPKGVPMSITVRKAVPSDGALILSLVEALAAYEKLTPPDREAGKRLITDLFSPRPRIDCYIAESDGKAAGYAFVLETYSSFLALPTLYLEDLFVLPECRGMKAGYELFTAMVGEARSRGCGRMEWTVLDWNELAINFYRRSGARYMKEWHLYRLVKDDMVRILDTKQGGTGASC
jgi:GNAT superfamily N-acetyltransferase